MKISRRSFLKGMSVGAAGLAGAAALGAVGCTSATASGEGKDAATLSGESMKVNMKPGTYVGEGKGFDDIQPIRVKIEVDEKNLLSVEVVDKEILREQPKILESAEQRLSERMLASQSLDVDTVTGATGCSFGIKSATEDALKKALRAGGSSEEAVEAFHAPVQQEGGSETLSYDIIVCGMGAAGCAAAMSAAEQQKNAGLPVSVLAIETAAKYGGAGANTGEIFSVNPPRRCQENNDGNDYCDADALYTDWMSKYYDIKEGTPCKPEIVKTFLEESGPTSDWLEYDHGFALHGMASGFEGSDWLVKLTYVMKSSYSKDPEYYDGRYPNYTFEDRFNSVQQYYDSMMGEFKDLGGEYMLETSCNELLYDKDSNKVTGIKAFNNATGKEYTINAKAVIICTGGFLPNGEMTAKYMTNPKYPYNVAWRMYGMQQNKGSMIESAIEQGMGTYNIDMPPCTHRNITAGTLTEFPVYYREGIDTVHYRQNSWSLNDLPYILGAEKNAMHVGPDGMRHYNEAAQFAYWAVGNTFYSIYGTNYINKLANEGLPGENGTYYDTKSIRYGCQGGYALGRPIPQIYEAMDAAVEQGYVVKADTLEELAEQTGFSVGDFVSQVERYNSYVKKGKDEEFGKDAAKLTFTIEEGPFYAITMKVTPYATVAALDVNEKINVLLADGETPAGGLYACGNDSGGVLESNIAPYAQYGGVAQGWAFTSGRLAGIHAVEYLQA